MHVNKRGYYGQNKNDEDGKMIDDSTPIKFQVGIFSTHSKNYYKNTMKY